MCLPYRRNHDSLRLVDDCFQDDVLHSRDGPLIHKYSRPQPLEKACRAFAQYLEKGALYYWANALPEFGVSLFLRNLRHWRPQRGARRYITQLVVLIKPRHTQCCQVSSKRFWHGQGFWEGYLNWTPGGDRTAGRPDCLLRGSY